MAVPVASFFRAVTPARVWQLSERVEAERERTDAVNRARSDSCHTNVIKVLKSDC